MKELGTAVTSAKALHKGDQREQTPQLQGCLHRGSPIALHGEQLPLSSVCCSLQLAGGSISSPCSTAWPWHFPSHCHSMNNSIRGR